MAAQRALECAVHAIPKVAAPLGPEANLELLLHSSEEIAFDPG